MIRTITCVGCSEWMTSTLLSCFSGKYQPQVRCLFSILVFLRVLLQVMCHACFTRGGGEFGRQNMFPRYIIIRGGWGEQEIHKNRKYPLGPDQIVGNLKRLWCSSFFSAASSLAIVNLLDSLWVGYSKILLLLRHVRYLYVRVMEGLILACLLACGGNLMQGSKNTKKTRFFLETYVFTKRSHSCSSVIPDSELFLL